MAEPGKETAAAPPTPPPPQEKVPQAPAAMVEPSLQTDTPISAPQDTETATGGAAALDSAQPKAKPAAVGAPEQTTTEADGQPPVATMPQKVAALPRPAETPAAQESAPTAATTPPPPPQKQEGGVPKLASSVHEEEKDAPKARAEEEGEKKHARRRWRCLRAAVCLLFLRPKSGGTKPATLTGDKQPASGLEEEKKPTAGEMPPPKKDSGSAVRVPSSKPEAGKETKKPAALDGNRPEPGQEQAATLPPPAETTPVAAESEAAKQLGPPAAQQPPRKQDGGAPEQAPSVQAEKDATAAAAPARPQEGARRRWRRLQAAVGLLFLRPKSGETKQPQEQAETKPGVDEMMKTSAQEQDGKKPPASGHEEQTPLMKKFRKVGRLVQFIVALTKPKKPQTASSGPGGEQGSVAKPEEEKPPAAPLPEEHWRREEVRLEDILEEAFAKLVAAEYVKELRGVRQKKCLLTFSVFDLAAEVKKQAMIYWWVAEFDLRHGRNDPPQPAGGGGGKGADDAAGSSRDDDADAERIFGMLSDQGFLVPMKNWCSEGIHGCQVNPLVHWMLKRQARGDRFAELDGKGSPVADRQRGSGILCLTSGNRPVLQKMRMKDDEVPSQTKKDEPRRLQSQAGRRSSKKVTKEPSSLRGKSSDVQDQQQLTTKDEAQVGSKSMAAADKAASKKDEDTTQANKDQLAKDQQQLTTKDEAQVGSKSMTVVDKAPSLKDKDQTQAKDQLTKGPQDTELSSELNRDDEIFQGKRVILNVNAHVYPISRSALLPLAECLVVLQLGRWNNVDDKTYMEVDGLESRDAIGLLKNLRYLGLRGLSRLSGLPKGIESLKNLVILDMRGCQNLVKVEASDNFIKQQLPTKRSAITQLKQLTHLDLTECYMLEHIGRGITSLTELQVFKGFVFATGTQGNKACRIQDLKKLKKLQKLTVSITTDANVAEGEMAYLKDLTSLQKLTITWSEIPSILEGECKEVADKRHKLVKRWTSFQLPKDLKKLDIRCYPKKELELEKHEKLEKLYLRGGDMEKFSTMKSETIKTLRLRYLKKFTMEWKDIRSELHNIEFVEIVVNKDATQEKDKSGVIPKDTQDEVDTLLKMNIPLFTLDRHGVWRKDQKEENNLAPNEVAMANNKVSGPSGPTASSAN